MDYLQYVDVKRMEYWLGKAMDAKDDSVMGFICVWIAFNYYYGNFFEVMYPEGSDWWSILGLPVEAQSRPATDRQKLALLATDELFVEQWEEFSEENAKLLSQTIKKPRRAAYLKSIEGQTNIDLSNCSRLLETLLTIRNNLFHGLKDPASEGRDKTLCKLGVTVLKPLVEKLTRAGKDAQKM